MRDFAGARFTVELTAGLVEAAVLLCAEDAGGASRQDAQKNRPAASLKSIDWYARIF
jgi:hypothetical protein